MNRKNIYNYSLIPKFATHYNESLQGIFCLGFVLTSDRENLCTVHGFKNINIPNKEDGFNFNNS